MITNSLPRKVANAMEMGTSPQLPLGFVRAIGAGLVVMTIGCGASTPTADHPRAMQEAQGATTHRELLPFIHDDYARAIAEAKRRNRFVFVDAWAPWCHSCLSMRAYVLSDPLLAPLANEFVWLAIDTEKDENAAFVAKFTNRVWPTLWVLDPTHEEIALRWEGTATAAELVTLLKTVRSESDRASVAAFLLANRAAARGELAIAEQEYRAIVANEKSPERARAAEALIGLLASRAGWKECTDLALDTMNSLPPGTSRAVVLVTGMTCAREASRSAELRRLVDAADVVARDPNPTTISDDRSALYEEISLSKKALGDADGARVTALAWAHFLEGEATRAPTKEARAVFDAHRVSAYLAADQPAKAIPILDATERDFPEDYNAPARLARVYLALKQDDDAWAAISRASARVYGPRVLRVHQLGADIAKARGDIVGERAMLQSGLGRTQTAILNSSQAKLRTELETRLRMISAHEISSP